MRAAFWVTPALIMLVTVAATAKPSDKEIRARSLATKNALDQIRTNCGLTEGNFSYGDEVIHFKYDGMVEYQKIQCASDLTTLLGIDFRTYDTSAPYGAHRRFIVRGRAKRVDMALLQAVAGGWTVNHRAETKDGLAFLELQAGPKQSRRSVQMFLDSFRNEFSDLAVGLAPWSLGGFELSTETAFRDSARRMYESLYQRSCNAPASFDRESLMLPAREKVAKLERELLPTPAGLHLSVAREDVRLEQSKEPGCWDDEDLAFAEKHVEMVHEAVDANSDWLRKVAPAVEPLSSGTAPADAAEFRYEVRNFITWTRPMCEWTSKGDNDAIFAGVRERIDDFKKRLGHTAYRVQFEIAEQDANYRRSQRIAECDDPGSETVESLAASALVAADKRIAELEALALP